MTTATAPIHVGDGFVLVPSAPVATVPARPPLRYADADGRVWEFTHVGTVTGHIGGRPFTTERWRVEEKPGYDRDNIGPLLTAAFADRHDGRKLRGLDVERSAGWFHLALHYGK